MMMMQDLDDLADRHFRADPKGILAPPAEARQARVLIAIEPAMAATKAGQEALWMLANSVCRQFRLVTGIALDIPSRVPLLPRVAAFGEAATLKEAVANCVRLAAGGHVELHENPAAPGRLYPIEIVVGRPGGAPRAAVRLILFADGWRLFLGHAFPFDELPRSDSPFGAYLGACFAAGEVFKRLRGMKFGKGEFVGEGRELCLSLWTTKTAASWDQLDRDPPLRRTDFPPLYFAGAGAVAEAAAISFAGLSDATAHATVIDPDPLDLSNDNRYALATLEDDEKPKAPFMADFLGRRGFTQYPYVGTWQDYVNSAGPCAKSRRS